MNLEQVLTQTLQSFQSMDDFKYKILEKLKHNLDETYNIPQGKVEAILSREPEDLLEEEDVRLISLFVKEFLELSDNNKVLEDIFTVPELKELEQYYYNPADMNIKLPLEMFPALKLNSTTHSVKMTAQMIAQLLESQILNYNYDIQREVQTVKRKGRIIKTPKINQKNINEMTELLLKGQLMDSTIYLNAAPRTAKDGDELLMNEKGHKLTIAEGTRLDILDGFHRCVASQKAYQLNPEIKFHFNVVISNYTTKEAQTWQSQHAKAMPWSANRVRELQQEKRSDKVVAAIRAGSVVSEYISAARSISSSHLTSFSVLSDAVDRYFKLETRRDEVDAIEKLTNYLDDLVQYDGTPWGRTRSNTLLLSRTGMFGIVYYISLQKSERSDTLRFYKFLDKLNEYEDVIRKEFGLSNFNQRVLSKTQIEGLEKKIEEVSHERV